MIAETINDGQNKHSCLVCSPVCRWFWAQGWPNKLSLYLTSPGMAQQTESPSVQPRDGPTDWVSIQPAQGWPYRLTLSLTSQGMALQTDSQSDQPRDGLTDSVGLTRYADDSDPRDGQTWFSIWSHEWPNKLDSQSAPRNGPTDMILNLTQQIAKIIHNSYMGQNK